MGLLDKVEGLAIAGLFGLIIAGPYAIEKAKINTFTKDLNKGQYVKIIDSKDFNVPLEVRINYRGNSFLGIDSDRDGKFDETKYEGEPVNDFNHFTRTYREVVSSKEYKESLEKRDRFLSRVYGVGFLGGMGLLMTCMFSGAYGMGKRLSRMKNN
ncbi:hypothetical protein KAT36_04210 [Candidatus Pacearchaeota archaeon]|nr:hypothetical protein [Candidatus Pacearchaeota archaeon]